MLDLAQWLQTYPVRAASCPDRLLLEDVVYDSRRVRPGVAFVCIRGSLQDGHLFLREALAKGAAAVVLEDPEVWRSIAGAAAAPEGRDAVAFVLVDDAREALASLCEACYGQPDRRLALIACAGDAGRESMARLGAALLRRAGFSTGWMAGMRLEINGEEVCTGRSVPQAREYATGLAAMVQAGCEAALLPLSHEAWHWKRAAFLTPSVAWTGELAALPELAEKEALLEAEALIIRTGTEAARELAEEAKKRGRLVLRYGFTEEADVRVLSIEPLRRPDGSLSLQTRLEWSLFGEKQEALLLPVPGSLHALHVLGLRCLWELVSRGLLRHKPGGETEKRTPAESERLFRSFAEEAFLCGHSEPLMLKNGLRLVIDSAWREDRLEALLRSLRPWVEAPGRLVLLFGSGGERPYEDRLAQGRACAHGADAVILTVSNPRSEGGRRVVSQLLEGYRAGGGRSEPGLYPDRREALAALLELGRPEDLLVVAGRGEEEYLIDAQSLDFLTDRELLLRLGR